MSFNSYEFIIALLPVTVAGFWLLSRRLGHTWALGWLLLTSIVFYARASLASLVIIAPSILLDYGIAQLLMRTGSSRERARNALFAAGVVANVLFLGYFKYRNFFLDTANTVFATHFEPTRLVLPLGISFLVFQKIAFLADVHSGEVKVLGFLEFLLFTLFFPRAVAGPIVHYQEIVPQFLDAARQDATDVAVGVCLFSIGLFKKTVIADSLGQFVSTVFGTPLNPESADLPPTMLVSWAALLAYTFQLYFDFSGYSDMALGVARMLGIRLPMNFNSPFKATNIVEFWGRWHITLTRFLTAYIYTPLVLRVSRARVAKNRSILRGRRSSASAIGLLVAFPTLTTMTISGLWHGAGWQYIVWGSLHGAYLTVNQSWRMMRPRFWPDQVSYERFMRPVGRVLTFGCVVVALAFFRAPSVSSAISILKGMAGVNGVFPQAVQLLRGAGIDASWRLLELELPVPAFWWFLALIPALNLLPNSLEILRRFHPACDFPQPEDSTPGKHTHQTLAPHYPHGYELPRPEGLRFKWRQLMRVGKTGVGLSSVVATLIALLCALGIFAINRGERFLYGQF